MFFFLASFRTLKISAFQINNADGKERRLNVTILQHGKPTKEVLHAQCLLRDTAKKVILNYNTTSSPLHNTTTQQTTAALVVKQLLNRIPFLKFQLTQMLSTTNVPTKKKMKVTGELLNTAKILEATSWLVTLRMETTANRNAVKEMKEFRLTYQLIPHKDFRKQSKPDQENKSLILVRSSTKLPILLQKEQNAVLEGSNSSLTSLLTNH